MSAYCGMSDCYVNRPHSHYTDTNPERVPDIAGRLATAEKALAEERQRIESYKHAANLVTREEFDDALAEEREKSARLVRLLTSVAPLLSWAEDEATSGSEIREAAGELLAEIAALASQPKEPETAPVTPPAETAPTPTPGQPPPTSESL